MKLWDKGAELDPVVERFCVGDDRRLDLRLVAYDCLGSRAHAEMLHAAGVLDGTELTRLKAGLLEIAELHAQGEFSITPDDEDCHSAIERFLTARCGEAGRKIHTARSRNDQVLTALRLYEKDALSRIRERLEAYGEALRQLGERQGRLELPGYTHMQPAMPSSVGLWAGCFAEAAADDVILVKTALRLVDRSPLGTAAGYGVPVIPVDREMTARMLGFGGLLENPIHAQLGRGKIEGIVIGACSQILHDLNRLASDLLLFSTREFGFCTLPERLCTGSSIMPQKRNPDLLELLRAKYHVVLAREFEVRSLVASLPSGYNRDVQLTKGPLIESLETTEECLEIARILIDRLEFDEATCAEALTSDLYATERAYELVKLGVPFRDAYRRVAADLAKDGSAGGG